MESKLSTNNPKDVVQVVEVDDETSQRRRANYAPFVTRSPFLLFICFIAILGVAGLQLAVRRSVPIGTPGPPARVKRQVTDISNGANPSDVSQSDGDSITTTPSKVENSFITITTSIADSGDNLRQAPADESASSTGLEASSARENDFITITGSDPSSTQIEASSARENDFITITGSDPSSTQLEASSARENDFITITKDGTSPTPTVVNSSPGASQNSDGTNAFSNGVYTGAYSESSNGGSAGNTITAPPGGPTPSSGSGTGTKVGPQNSLILTNPSATKSYKTYTSATTLPNGSVSSVVVVEPTSKAQGVIPELLDGPVVQLPIHFEKKHYVFAMYGGAFVAVVLKILWACVYSANKMMEPFYQLSRKSGASARESLMADYLSSGISWWSLKVMCKGHWVMLLTVLVSVLIGLLPPFATEAMSIRALSLCKINGLMYPCNPVWILNLNMVRALQALLSLIAFCIIMIVILGMRRTSGLIANPSSIASMATLLHHPELVREIQNIPADATSEEIAAALAHNRYIIGTYRDAHGQEKTGLMRARVDFHESNPEPAPYHVEYVQLNNPGDTRKRSMSREAVDKLIDALLIFLVMGIFVVAVAYWLDGSESGFNRFFNSDNFGPRFILTSAASLIAMAWLDLEREVRILTPYRILARRNAQAKRTILTSVDGYPYTSLFGSLQRRTPFHFFVALSAVLSDILIIATSGIPFSSAQIRLSYIAATWVTVGILIIMIPVIGWLFVWRRVNKRLLIPRQPNETLLRTWMGIANEGNNIRALFDGWDGTSKQSRNEHCLGQEWTYYAGWVRDSDGKERWCVDKEGNGYVPEY